MSESDSGQAGNHRIAIEVLMNDGMNNVADSNLVRTQTARTNGFVVHANGDGGPRPPLSPDQPDPFDDELSAERLADCGTIRLPRSDEKSLLVMQYKPAMQSALEAYRTLRTRLERRQAGKGMRSLVISSAAQGEGKTLTTFNLALCYAKMQNFPVLMVDADLRSQGLSQLMGDPQSPGLGTVLEERCDYASAILATDSPGLYALPAGSSTTSPPELLARPGWKVFIAWATETFRLVIVDSPPVLNVADFELVMAPCDSVILVVRSRKTGAGYLTRVLAESDPNKLAGVVFNATEERTVSYYPYGSRRDRGAPKNSPQGSAGEEIVAQAPGSE